jgi:hypothetical protein
MLIKGYNRTMRKIEADMAEGGAPDEERIRRAQQDPEVRAILSDPVMQSVSCLLCTVTFYANHAHSLTRSP